MKPCPANAFNSMTNLGSDRRSRERQRQELSKLTNEAFADLLAKHKQPVGLNDHGAGRSDFGLTARVALAGRSSTLHFWPGTFYQFRGKRRVGVWDEAICPTRGLTVPWGCWASPLTSRRAHLSWCPGRAEDLQQFLSTKTPTCTESHEAQAHGRLMTDQ